MLGICRDFKSAVDPCNTTLQRPPRGLFSYPGVSKGGVRHPPASAYPKTTTKMSIRIRLPSRPAPLSSLEAKCSKSRDLTETAICDSNRESQITGALRQFEPPQKSSM